MAGGRVGGAAHDAGLGWIPPPAGSATLKRGEMAVAELQELEQVTRLGNRGQQLGVLTYAEIAGAVSELDLDEADVEELHGFLERAEIELVEEVDHTIAA